MITPLRAPHIRSVAELHCATLTGLISQLGLAAARAWYAGCVRTDVAIALVDTDGSEVRGFAVGSTHPDQLQKEVVRRNTIGTIAAVGRGLANNPSALSSLIESMRDSSRESFDRSVPSLIYLAVDPRHHGTGLGRGLLDAFTERMRAAGANYYDLSVDDTNDAGIAFYERMGFREIGRYREFDLMHRRYRLKLA